MKKLKVKLYSTKTCPYCMMEKDWLENEKIEHEVVFVDSDHKEAMDMVKKTGQMGVPVTQIEFEDGREEYIVGFDKPTLEYYLKSQ